MKRKVCVFTGTRAEYGLLRPLIELIRDEAELELQLLVSGMHLSPEFGLTASEIEKDGFKIDERVEMLLSSDSPVGICKSMGLGMIGFSEALNRLNPDLLVILGDRFEGFAAASAAMICRIPIAHLHGGEATYGLIDEPIRHSITKMSLLHFTSTDEYRNRVVQLGENPKRVFNVGAIGLENIKKLKLVDRPELDRTIGFDLGQKSILVTYHPVTLEEDTARQQMQSLLAALDYFADLRIIFTKGNADTGGRVINSMIDSYVEQNRNRSVAFTSMGQLLYLSAMNQVKAVVGNSSSGIIEAPGFKIPTVNIGDRQKGRVMAESVLSCGCSESEIREAVSQALSEDFQRLSANVSNPYEKEDTALVIKDIIKEFDLTGQLKKEFYDVRT